MKRTPNELLGELLNKLEPEYSATPTIEDEDMDYSYLWAPEEPKAKPKRIQRSLAEQAAALLRNRQRDQL
ncbi:hypothetical protein ACFL3T_05350 [Patescibacteria group bacterium]